ncbi:MAG: hypothetical protein QNJ97_02355 [Myxococcota bacterium]|nr:hypothetical protein [Myxococcota bacterium]
MGLENDVYTLFAAVAGGTTIAQDNPILFEQIAPTPGNPWSWSVEGMSGNFVAGTTFDFDYAVGFSNPNRQYAKLTWTIPAWINSDGATDALIDGSLLVRISNATEGDSYATVSISLRTLKHTAFALFEGETRSDSPISDLDSSTYSFGAPANDPMTDPPGTPDWRSVEIPDDLDIAFSNRGSMSVISAGTGNDWFRDGTFSLSIQNGTQPVSIVRGLDLSLRKLDHTGFTLFADQSAGGSALPAVDPGTYVFEAPANDPMTDPPGTPDWRVGIPDDVGISVDDYGGLSMAGPGSAAWNETGTFTLSIGHGARPVCYIGGLDLSLRRLDHNTWTLFAEQRKDVTGGGPNVPIAETYGFSPSDIQVDGVAYPDTAIEFDGGGLGQGRITDFSFADAAFGFDGSFTLTIADGTRPVSVLSGTSAPGLALRRLTPNPLRIPVDETQAVDEDGTASIAVLGDAVSDWTFSGFSASVGISTISLHSTTAKQLTVQWALGGLNPGDSGLVSFTMERTSHGGAPSGTVDLPARVRGHVSIVAVPGGSPTLPSATENRRYECHIGVAGGILPEPILPGDTVTWELDPAFGGLFQLDPSSDDFHRWLRTIASPVTYIPEGWGGTTQTIPVRVNHYRDGVLINGGNWEDLTLAVSDQQDDYDVAILLDRSGSMAGNRWTAAVSGAEIFAALVDAANSMHVDNDPLNPMHAHRVGLYWFWGHDSAGYGDNYPNPPGAPADPAYPDGFTGTFVDDSDPMDIKDFSLNGGAVHSHLSDITPVGMAHAPGHYTALGAGLLLCRKELITQAEPGADRKRMILVLTDGMENRDPTIDQLFVAPGLWFQDEADPSVTIDPETQIFACAVFTGAAYVAKLGDVAAHVGGVAATDVKSITDPVDYSTQMQHWFINRFSEAFDFVETTAPLDPTLGPNETKVHRVKAHLGQDKLVFYMLLDAPDTRSAGWRFVIRPPGAPGVITPKHHNPGAGIVYKEGALYKMYIIDMPLSIPGHDHRLAGNWEAHVTRTKNKSGSYAFGSLAHQAELTMRAEVLAPAKPRPGDMATLQIALRQGNKAINGAKITADVCSPGHWPGHDVACMISANLDLVRKLRRSRSADSRDTPHLADQVVRSLFGQRAITGEQRKTYKLIQKQQVAGRAGIYEAKIPLSDPGQYTIDAHISGIRASSLEERNNVLGTAIAGLPYHYTSRGCRREMRLLERTAGKDQAFVQECRKQVHVGYLADPTTSEVQGYFVDGTTIRLAVLPKDTDGTLLGPGWAHGVVFVSPLGIGIQWPSSDIGNGSYWVDMPLEAAALRFNPRSRALIARHLTLTHPTRGPISPVNAALPIDGFAAHVIGVSIPITVRSLIGNKATKEVHLASCSHASRIAEKNKVWLHDLSQAKKCSYDTCEWCLPLICNANPTAMEAHKPFCSHTRRIRVKNRFEVHSWTEAKKLGFDGCRYCLPDKHTR